MDKDEAKAEVARLLLERAEMKRLGTDLSPDKLMLLKRLMYRLGMNNVKLQRREALLRLARRIGVKRYAEPVDPTQPVPPSGPLAPWRNPAPQPSAPKKTTKALQTLREKAALVPVTDEPLPQVPRPANTSRSPSRRRQVDESVRNVPGGFDIHGSRRGLAAFREYLEQTGEDSELNDRLERAIRDDAENYDPEIDSETLSRIAESQGHTPETAIRTLQQHHPEAPQALRTFWGIHEYRPRPDQPNLFDPGSYPESTHLQDWLADTDDDQFGSEVLDYIGRHHPELDRDAISDTLDDMHLDRRSDIENGISDWIDQERRWYADNADASEHEPYILQQMHEEMANEGRWDERPEDEPEEDEEDDEYRMPSGQRTILGEQEAETPQLNVVNSNEPPQQLPTAEPKPITGGPQFGRWYGDSRVHTYRFQTPSGRPFTIDIGHYNEGNTKIDNLTFNDDRHSFDDTGKGEAAAVFDQVAQAVTAYMQAKKPHVLTFSAATTDGQATGGKSRQNLYTSLIKRIGQIDPNYAAAAIPSPGGGKNFVVFDRTKVDEVERLIQSKFSGRGGPALEPIILSRRRSLLARLARRMGVRRYAKLDGHVTAHPLVQGFPIETALRHLANDPNNHPAIRELAKVAVTGGKEGDGSNIPMALWALHDELHTHKHPAKDWYNWMSAADKIGLDAHTLRAATEHAERVRQFEPIDLNQLTHWNQTPEHQLYRAHAHVAKYEGQAINAPANEQVHAAITNRVKQLAPSAQDKDIDESIRRGYVRAINKWHEVNGLGSTYSNTGSAFHATSPLKKHPNENMKATRYRRILRRLARKPSGTEGLKRYGKSSPEDVKRLEQAVIENPSDANLIHALADAYAESGDEWRAKSAHELRSATGPIRIASQAYPTTPVILKKTVRGRDYAAHAPDDVIKALQGLEGTPRRVHVHSGYVVGPQAGRDWIEDHDVQGRIGVSRGLGVANEPLRHLILGRSAYGTPVDGGHVVRIRDLQTGQDLYRHPQYHHGKIEIRPNPIPNNPEYTHGVFRDGDNIANFKGDGKAEKWVNKMGLTLHDPNNAYQGKLSRKGSPARYKMVAGDFLDALQRIRSSDQHAIRKTTEEIAAKLGLKPASTVDALHNSPAYSVPGVAQAIYANASPESIHAAAAWYGLTGNIPGMAVFHVRPDGPDMLHRFRMQGSGHDMLQKLDKAGITDRVLVPHRKGFDLLIPDRGGKLRDRVSDFTRRQKTELQSSRGHFKLIGAADQAKAREMFRNTITKQEQKAV